MVIAYNGSKTFTATPYSGYTADEWSLDGSVVQSGGTTYTLENIKANHTVTVSFAQAYGTLKVTLTPSSAKWRPSTSTTWLSSGTTISLIAYGDSSSYGLYFQSCLGYDTPSTMGGIHVYPDQLTTKSVTYSVLTRYVSLSGNDSSNTGKTSGSPWRTIKYAIKQVDTGGGGNLYFTPGDYSDESISLSDLITLDYMTNCKNTSSSAYVLIKPSQSVFPSNRVSFSGKFLFNQ